MTKLPRDVRDGLAGEKPEGDVRVPEYVEAASVPVGDEAGEDGGVAPAAEPRRVPDGEETFSAIRVLTEKSEGMRAEVHRPAHPPLGWTDLTRRLYAVAADVHRLTVNVFHLHGYRLPASEARQVGEETQALVDAVENLNRRVDLLRRESKGFINVPRLLPGRASGVVNQSFAYRTVEDAGEDGARECHCSRCVAATQEGDLEVVQVGGLDAPDVEVA